MDTNRRLPLTVILPGFLGLAGMLAFYVLSPSAGTVGTGSPLLILLVVGLVAGILGRGWQGWVATLVGGLIGIVIDIAASMGSLGYDGRKFFLAAMFLVIIVFVSYSIGWALCATFREAVRSTFGNREARRRSPARFRFAAAIPQSEQSEPSRTTGGATTDATPEAGTDAQASNDGSDGPRNGL
jgi:hypothetical protein